MTSHQRSPPDASPPRSRGLDERHRIRIALLLGRRRATADQAALLHALRERGRAAGMNGAEMTANEAGSSHEAKATACLDFVTALLDGPQGPTRESLRRMRAAGFRPAEIDEVIALATPAGA